MMMAILAGQGDYWETFAWTEVEDMPPDGQFQSWISSKSAAHWKSVIDQV
jgi:hypothetical protein